MEIARHWRIRGQRYGLTGTICTQCGKVYFAPRAMCNECQVETGKTSSYEHSRLMHNMLSQELAHR